MSQKKLYKCYLAGPISGCNKNQKIKWRDKVKALLEKTPWECVDPVTELVRWTPLKEAELIDKVDVVIANLWRESIGTIVGIMQAIRLSKKVILVTETFIESPVLFQIVGEKNVETTLDKIIPHLQEFEARRLKQIKVLKRDGSVEDFDAKKIIRKLSDACAKADLNDVWLPSVVTSMVEDTLYASPRYEITAENLRDMVAENLHGLANREDVYHDDVETKTGLVLDEWNDIAKRKAEQNELNAVTASYDKDMKDLKEENRELRNKVCGLEGSLLRKGTPIEISGQASQSLRSMAAMQAKLTKGECVCVRSKHDPSFLKALSHVLDLEESTLHPYFTEVEEEHDGKLISRLQKAYDGKIILYPHEHLKTFKAEYKKPFKKVVSAPRVSDVARKFASWLQS